MHILIDASCLMKELTGIGVYTRHLLQGLSSLKSDMHFTLFLNALKGSTPNLSFLDESRFRIVRRRIPGKALLECWRRYPFPTVESLAGVKQPDIFHSPNFFYQATRCARIIATVHDVAFLKQPRYGSRYSGRYHRETLMKNLHRVAKIIVVSNSVKHDVMELCGVPESKIKVIHHGLDSRFSIPEDREESRKIVMRHGFPEHFILSVGTIEERKNHKTLIQAYTRLKPLFSNVKLVVAGRLAEGFNDLEKWIHDAGITGDVILPGYVPVELLPELYRAALVTVFPSWEEGFGFPPLESAACGTPVVASDIPAHREILDDVAWYFPPFDVDALFDILRQLLSDEPLRKKNIVKGVNRARRFSWEEAAREHVKTYREAFNENPV